MKKFKDGIITALKGFLIGASMSVPGVSGGSMAMILGIYDKLLEAVSGIFKKFWKNAMFLLIFAVGGGLGFFLLASRIEDLMILLPIPVALFFVGTVAGGMPMMIKKAQVKKFSFMYVVYVAVGILLVYLISLIPKDLLNGSTGGIASVMISFVAGVVIAIALILPGISTAHMLLILGIYTPILTAVKEMNIVFFIPIGVGLIVGTFATAGILTKLMKKYPQATYMVIIGFMLASLVEIFPPITLGWPLVLGVVTLAIGFVGVYFISKLDPD